MTEVDKKERMAELGKEIDEWIRKWQLEGAEPNANFMPNHYVMSTKINLLYELAKEALGLDDDDITIRYMEEMVKNLDRGYHEIVDLKEQATKPKIDIFRGLPPNMNGRMN